MLYMSGVKQLVNYFRILVVSLLFSSVSVFAADGHDNHEGHNHDQNDHILHGSEGLKKIEHEEGSDNFDPVEMIMHHIKDAHEWHLFDLKGEDGETHGVSIPLPVILYTEGNLDVFMSSEFNHGHSTYKTADGEREYANHHEHITELSGKSVLDFSITKNVFALFFSAFLMVLIFIAVASNYKKNTGAPKGIAKFMEPLIVFVRDEIAKPNISNKPEKYMPYLLSVFFFIWLNNLLGLVPFFPGGANLTGNISFTLVLATFTMIVTNINGNKNYWKHTFMPPVPAALWPIMIPVEIIGILTKPFALMIRLFANITAGHIIILSLVSLIFIFKSVAISPVSIGFMLFMNCLELLVAALQAYIFTLLSALFIGMATEEAHH